MVRQSIRSSKSLVLRLALSAFMAAGIAGCSESGSTESEGSPVAQPQVQNVRITATDIDNLASDQWFNADLVTSKVIYHFDYADKAIDFARVNVVVGKDASFPITPLFSAVKQNDYGANPAPDLLAAPDHRFSIASDATYFGELNESQLAELQADGYFYTKSPATSPSGSPQSIDDDCIHAVCIIHIDAATGGLYDWSNPPPYPPLVIREEHVWCDP